MSIKVGRLRVERLTRRADFLRVAAGRRKYVAPGLVLQALRRAPEPAERPIPVETIRVGFTATRKIGSSVVRNRARRRLREAAREALAGATVPGFDYVVIARAGSLNRPYPELVGDLRAGLAALSRQEKAA